MSISIDNANLIPPKVFASLTFLPPPSSDSLALQGHILHDIHVDVGQSETNVRGQFVESYRECWLSGSTFLICKIILIKSLHEI